MRTRFTELIGCRVPNQLAGTGWVRREREAPSSPGATC